MRRCEAGVNFRTSRSPTLLIKPASRKHYRINLSNKTKGFAMLFPPFQSPQKQPNTGILSHLGYDKCAVAVSVCQASIKSKGSLCKNVSCLDFHARCLNARGFFGKIGMLVTLIYMYTYRCTENCSTNKVVWRFKKRGNNNGGELGSRGNTRGLRACAVIINDRMHVAVGNFDHETDRYSRWQIGCVVHQNGNQYYVCMKVSHAQYSS